MQDLLSWGRTDRGYNLLEMLLGLLVVSLLLVFSQPLLAGMKKLTEFERYDYQDEIGIYQLQTVLACNRIISVEDDEIIYQGEEEPQYLHLTNFNLISTPGWLCFIRGIDDASFRLNEDIIMLTFIRDGDFYEYPIAYYRSEE